MRSSTLGLADFLFSIDDNGSFSRELVCSTYGYAALLNDVGELFSNFHAIGEGKPSERLSEGVLYLVGPEIGLSRLLVDQRFEFEDRSNVIRAHLDLFGYFLRLPQNDFFGEVFPLLYFDSFYLYGPVDREVWLREDVDIHPVLQQTWDVARSMSPGIGDAIDDAYERYFT